MNRILLMVIMVIMVVGCSNNAEEETSDITEETAGVAEETGPEEVVDLEEVDKEFIELEEATISDIGLSYIEALVSEDYDRMLETFDVTEQMKEALNKEMFEQITAQTASNNGEFIKIVGQNTFEQDGYTVVAVGVTYEKNQFAWRVVFDQDGKIAGLTVGLFEESVMEEESSKGIVPVTFGEDDFLISGEIHYPEGDGPFPGIVLVHGSGPHDRYETIGPNAVFKDIAKALNEKGIAVLVYDKRTLTHGAAMVGQDMTVNEETVLDAQYAINLLRDSDKIMKNQLYVLGHSLGGYLLPRIYNEDLNLAGVIFMAGSADPLEELIVMQIDYLSNLDGEVTAEEKAQMDAVVKIRDEVQSDDLSMDSDPNLLMGIPGSYWLDLRGYDPVEMATDINTRILFLQGDRDYQVPVDQLEQYRERLGEQADYILYPGLNHLMMAGEGEPNPTEYGLPNHVSNQVTNDIAKFILE